MSTMDEQYAFVAFIIIMFTLLGITCAAGVYDALGPTHIDRVNIKSMADQTLIHGSFTLGTGSIDENPVYIYYYNVDDAVTWKQGHIRVEMAKVHEDTEMRPYIDITKSPFGNVRFMDFHVPNNTVYSYYALDSRV